MQVQRGRYSIDSDDDVVVFLIGMRINKPLRVRAWLPVLREMSPMLRELFAHPEKGMLGAEFGFLGRGPVVVQYWRSFDDLERFARNPDDPHLPAWRRFNQRARGTGAVGVWHETYLTGPGTREAIYVNMPAFGLGAATASARVGGARDSARARVAG
jgi:hypothetical protein